MDTKTLVTIITSAAVGTFVAALVAILGQYIERRARRQELLLTKAIELAKAEETFLNDLAKSRHWDVPLALLHSPLARAAKYFDALSHLMDKGKLPKKVVEQIDKELAASEKKPMRDDGAETSENQAAVAPADD